MRKFTLLFLTIVLSFVSWRGYAQFTEGFESGIPATWTVINGGDTNTWTTSTDAPHSGTNHAEILYGSTAHNDYLITQSITVQAGVNDQLSFWGKSRMAAFPEIIDVKLSTTTPTAAAFTVTLIDDLAPPSGTVYYKYAVDLTAYVGQTVYIGFHSTTTDMFVFDIDDVASEPKPLCPAPTTLALVSSSGTSATFGWTAGASETQWDIEWGVQGFAHGAGTMITGTTVKPYTLNGLTYNTHYDAYVRANCGGSQSTWIGPLSWHSVDLAQCATVVSPADGATNVAVGSVNFAWAAATTGEPATSYNMYYGLTPSTVTNLVGNYTTTSALINVTGNNTTFYWQIRPVNGAGETQGCPIWSFTTEQSWTIPYCGPLAYGSGVEPITLVNFSGINNETDATVGGTPAHENFISVQGTVVQGQTYPITLKGNTDGNFTSRFVVFIDWNQNQVLNDTGEVYFGDGLLTIVNSTGTDAVQATGNIAVPGDALSGVTRMRVKKLYGTTNTADPCIGASYGQAEDYSVNVTAAASLADNTIDGFDMYPNPVSNTLNLRSLNNIDAISIYNMLGQELLIVNPSSTVVQLDITHFSIGSYIVKVKAGSQIGAYNLIKQ